MKFDELLNNVTDEIIDESRQLADSVINETCQAVPDFKNATHRKMKEMVDELHDDLPIFERAGYKLDKLEVELGIAPKLIPHFKVEKLLCKEEQDAILKEVRPNRILHLLLSSLFKASYLKDIMQIGNLDFHALKIELAASPKVHLIFW